MRDWEVNQINEALHGDEILDHICVVCHKPFKGEHWKKRCYECWKDYKTSERIRSLGYKQVFYVTHPSVTKEELDEYIKKYKLEKGWGVEEMDLTRYKDKFKVWTDSTNWD